MTPSSPAVVPIGAMSLTKSTVRRFEQTLGVLSMNQVSVIPTYPDSAILLPGERRLDRLNLTFVNDTFSPDRFVNTHEIIKMTKVPRFGHSKDINLLVDAAGGDSSEGAKDYFVGCLICSFLIFAVFVVWGLALAAAKIAERKKKKRRRKLPIDSSKGSKSAIMIGGQSSNTLEASSRNIEVKDDSLHIDEKTAASSFAAMNSDKDGCVPSNSSKRSISSGDTSEKKEGHNMKETCATTLTRLDHAGKVDQGSEMKSFASNDASACRSTSMGTNKIERLDESQQDAQSSTMISSRNNVRSERRLVALRVLIIFCGLAIIACAGLMVAKGFHSLTNSLRYIGDSIDQAENVADRALNISDYFLEVQNETLAAIGLYNKIAPDMWCPPIINITNEGVRDAIEALEDDFGRTLEAIAPLLDSLDQTVRSFQDDIQVLLDMFNTIDKHASTFSWAHYIAAAFVAILVVMVVVILVDNTLALANIGFFGNRTKPKVWKPIKCLTHTAFSVVFWFMLFLMWLFSTIFVLGSVVSADFCLDSPDPQISTLLQIFGEDSLGSFTYSMLQYYIHRCEDSYFPTEFEDDFWMITVALVSLHEMLESIGRVPLDEATDYCGEQITLLFNFTNFFDAQDHNYISALANTREVRQARRFFFENVLAMCALALATTIFISTFHSHLIFHAKLFFCSNFYPIYADIANDSMCYNGVTGLTWLFSTQFAVAVLCMIIITARMTLEHSKKDATEDQDEGGGRSCCMKKSNSVDSDLGVQ